LRLNQFIFFVATTVCVGAIVGWAVTITGLFIHVSWLQGLISGAFFSTTCLMGFWAYLMLNFIAYITLPRRVWRWAQALLIGLALFDMLYLRYQDDVLRNPVSHPPYWVYLLQGLWPFVAAVAAAVWKRRMAGTGSFLPAVFFLYVFTVLDGLLVIWSRTGPIVNQATIVLMACNIYMLLIYGKLLEISARRSAAKHKAGASSGTGPASVSGTR
jgi:KinB signaling pathway activation protein